MYAVCSVLKPWLYGVWSGIAMEKNWALSVDQRWLQVLQFSVHLINLLSMLLILWFRQDSESVVDQLGSRPPNSDHDLFLVQVWLWEVLWSFFVVQPLSWSSLVAIENPLFIPCHNLIEESLLCGIKDDTSKLFFFDLHSAHEAPTY